VDRDPYDYCKVESDGVRAAKKKESNRSIYTGFIKRISGTASNVIRECSSHYFGRFRGLKIKETPIRNFLYVSRDNVASPRLTNAHRFDEIEPAHKIKT